MTATTILFDLDGTLFDTSGDLLASLNHILSAAGLDTLSVEDVGFRFGQGARAMISHGFAYNGKTIAEDELARLTDAFVDHYAENMPGLTRPFPGLLDALDRLESAGFKLAVCTNKREDLARKLIDALGLTHRFAAICGGDSFPFRKPEAEHLLMTLEAAGGTREKAIMIGDSISDILGAQNARIPSIAVTFGYSDVPVESLGPDWVINHFDELDIRKIAK